MFSVRRQHPVAAISKVLDIIRGNFITIVIILFIGGTGDEQSMFNLTWIIGTILFLLIWGILAWFRFTFRVEDEQLIIEHGVLVRQKLYLSKDRIQVIDISSGVIQRMFGLVSVEVKTAGTSTKEARIDAVTKETARELRDLLRRDSAKQPETLDEEAPVRTYRLDTRSLLVAASTSGSFGVALSIVGTAFSQIDQIFSEEEIVQFIESVLPASLSSSLILYSVITILVISWILSFLGTVIKYAGFTVRLKEDELIISRGLFERKQLTIPYDRIQAVQLKEELLREPFGYVTVNLDSAGYGDESGKSVTLFPLISRKLAVGFIEQILPEYADKVTSLSPPSRSLRRYIVRMSLLTMLIVIPAWLLIPYGYYAFFLLVVAPALGYSQFKDAGIGVNKDTLILRYRLLSRNTVIIKKYRIQTIETRQTLLQKRSEVANVTVTVASGNEGHQFTVRDLDEKSAVFFWEWSSVYAEDSELAGKSLFTLPSFG